MNITQYSLCSWFFRNVVMLLRGPRETRASQVALVVKNPPANAGDVRDLGLIYESGRSPGGGHGNPLQLQYSCLKSPRDRGAWWATVHRIAKSQTRLKRLNTHTQRRPCNFTGAIGHRS